MRLAARRLTRLHLLHGLLILVSLRGYHMRVEAPSLSQGVLAVRRDVDNRHRHTQSVLQTLEPRGTR